MRFQVFSLLIFGGSCAFSTVFTFHSRSTGTIDVVAFVHVFSRVIILVGTVVCQVYFGWRTNMMASARPLLFSFYFGPQL